MKPHRICGQLVVLDCQLLCLLLELLCKFRKGSSLLNMGVMGANVTIFPEGSTLRAFPSSVVV